MGTPRDSDQLFDDNLRMWGRRVSVSPGPSPEVRDRCVAVFETAERASLWSELKMVRKPIIVSGLGLAAAVAILVTLVLPLGGNGPTVQAATILAKFNEQLEQNPRIDITIDSLSVDEAFVNGHLQVSNRGVAGEIQAIVEEDGPDSVVEVDLALGLSPESSWVLIRKLVVPDPQAQAILGMFLPPGEEVLLLLPADSMGELDLDIGDGLAELRSGELAAVFQELVNSHADLGATVEYQPDGTILLTLPIEDAEALGALERFLGESLASMDDESAEDQAEVGSMEIDMGGGDNELIGCTLTIVYDPNSELIRSFGIDHLGDADGSIRITIGEGEIDPALLDSSRVASPNTRTLDISALAGMLEGLGAEFD